MGVDRIKYCSEDVKSIIASVRDLFEGEGDKYYYKFNKIKGSEYSEPVKGSCFFLDYGDIQIGGIRCYPERDLVVEREVLDNPDFFTFQYRQLCASLYKPTDREIKDSYITPIVSNTYVSLSNITADNNIVKSANNYILYISVKKSIILDMLPEKHPILNIVKRNEYHLTSENDLNLQVLFYSFFNLNFSSPINRRLAYAKTWEAITSTIVLFDNIKLSKRIDKMTVAYANKVRMVIMKNLSLNLSVAEISAHLDIDSTDLSKAFKLVFSETIHKFYSRKRLELSARMLLTENYNVSEIAIYMGYIHLGHFSTKFRDFFGLLPKDFCRQFIGCRGVMFKDQAISRYCCSIPEMEYSYKNAICSRPFVD